MKVMEIGECAIVHSSVDYGVDELSRQEWPDLLATWIDSLINRFGVDGLMEIDIKWDNDQKLQLKASAQKDHQNKIVRMTGKWSNKLDWQIVIQDSTVVGAEVQSTEMFDAFESLEYLD